MREPKVFSKQYGWQKENKLLFEEALFKRLDEIQLDVRTSNQRYDKILEEHSRTLTFHSMALKNLEVQVGQLAQAK